MNGETGADRLGDEVELLRVCVRRSEIGRNCRTRIREFIRTAATRNGWTPNICRLEQL